MPRNSPYLPFSPVQWARSAVLVYLRWRHVVHPTYKYFNLWMWIRMSASLYW